MKKGTLIAALLIWSGWGVLSWMSSGPLDASPESVQVCLKLNLPNAYRMGCDQGELGAAVNAAISEKLGYDAPVCVGIVCR